MKKKLYVLSIITIFAFICLNSTHCNNRTISVLFVGNSLTSANNLPGMVADIAESHGYKMVCDSHTPGGATLANHASNSKVLQKIKKGTWNFVVLQEQSQYPGFSREQVSKEVFPHAKHLSEAVKNANDRSKVVFYMTMARRNGDPDNKDVSPELLTYEGMQKRINQRYIEMGENNRALIAPVGEVWKVVREENPSLNLYSDNIHPNTAGTYLAACVFYTVFFNRSSVGSYIPSHLDSHTAQYIQKVVDRIVLTDKW
ncbi:MAG: hypothetical protein GY795_29470 [Desulfobacterales bacterium]|nr:hypothetical protein [Desulfobacterales bacterium]